MVNSWTIKHSPLRLSEFVNPLAVAFLRGKVFAHGTRRRTGSPDAGETRGGGSAQGPYTAGRPRHLLPKDPVMGAIALCCFAAPNLIGWWLWRQRERLAAYPAIQTLALVEGLFALLVVVSMHLRSAMGLLPRDTQVSIGAMYACLFVFPAVMLQFWIQERGTRRALEKTQPMN